MLLATAAQAQMAVTSESYDSEQLRIHGDDYKAHIRNTYEVLDIDVDVVMRDQIAEVSVTQTIQNPGDADMEIQIMFPLPNDGIVQNFVMMVDGEEIPGELLPAAEARQIYEGIVRRKRDPALMEYAGYGLYKTSIFPMQVGEQRKITLRYTQTNKMDNNMITFMYPFGTQKFSAKPLRSATFSGRIVSNRDIKTIYSPTDDIRVMRNSDRIAEVEWEEHYFLPDHDLKLVYSLQNGSVGASLMSFQDTPDAPGYFMLMANPSLDVAETREMPKNIVFIIDRSGSMAGSKIEQSRKAMQYVLENLNENDMFNIVGYDDRILPFANQLMPNTKENQESAMEYVSLLNSGGGTNIHEALETGLGYFTHNEMPNYVLFLTDGLPTAGNTTEADIVGHSVAWNEHGARMFVFGVGNDVNARLLDRLALEHGGKVEYVQPNEDIEASVASLYGAISDPVLTDIYVEFQGVSVSEVYPQRVPDMFKGGQLVLSGKYKGSGEGKVIITGMSGGKRQTFEFPVSFNDHRDPQTHSYVEKVWASKRVADLITQIDQNGQNQELVDELIKLSKEYGILTPYTSFLAREDVDFADNTRMVEESESRLQNLENVQGESANAQRRYKNRLAESSGMAMSAPMEDMEFVEKEEEVAVATNIRNIGSKTFYNKDNTWVDGEIAEQESERAIQINRFSKEYFELSKGQHADFNQYLSMDGEVLVRLNGSVYHIVD